VGLLSRTGIIPVTYKTDTPGPMTRTVREAALLLNAMTGSDNAKPIKTPQPIRSVDYTKWLQPTRTGLAVQSLEQLVQFNENAPGASIPCAAGTGV
jgi:Asp-tRNA(Asn)/Glu-tRNA(Gln) amidotransferase A subunit family amidase